MGEMKATGEPASRAESIAARESSHIAVTVRVDNAYADGTVSSVESFSVPRPPSAPSEAVEAWAMDHLFPLTGTGRSDDAVYTVMITQCSDPQFVGWSFEW